MLIEKFILIFHTGYAALLILFFIHKEILKLNYTLLGAIPSKRTWLAEFYSEFLSQRIRFWAFKFSLGEGLYKTDEMGSLTFSIKREPCPFIYDGINCMIKTFNIFDKPHGFLKSKCWNLPTQIILNFCFKLFLQVLFDLLFYKEIKLSNSFLTFKVCQEIALRDLVYV